MLDTRSARVLKSVVEFYIERMEPVGSGALARMSGFNLCAASIRNVMADLEKAGFLTQPHTSAGRVPTDKGYRYYANTLIGPERLPRKEMDNIKLATGNSEWRELAEYLASVSRTLSSLSMQASLVGLASWGVARIRKIRLVNLESRLVMAVIVFEGGGIRNHLIRTEEAFDQDSLGKMSNYFNHHLSGMSMESIRMKLLEEMAEEKNRMDTMLSRALRIAEAIEEQAAPCGGESIYLDGASNLIDYREARPDLSRIKALFKAFDEKGKLVGILNECLKEGKMKLIIGSESQMDELADFSVVAHPFSGSDGSLGAVGILGPKSMNYAHTIALVRYAASQMSLALTRQET